MPEKEPEWSNDVSRLAVGDVIRWTDPIWPENKRRRRRTKGAKRRPNGDQRVTAQLLELDSRDYLRLVVIKAEIKENPHGMPLKAFKKGEIVVKKRTTITQGNPERLKWVDEAQRSIEVSEFLR